MEDMAVFPRILQVGYLSRHYSKSNLFFSFLIATALLVSAACNKSAQPNPMAMMAMQAVPVRAAEATQADVPLGVSAVGNVESMTTVDVKSRVAGQVLLVAFQEGQNVTKGQLLFEIDPEPLNRQIAELQADIAKDTALEQQAHANIAKDQAQAKQTSAAAERGLSLSKEGIFSKEQTEQVVATNDSALASIEADKAALESASASLKADHARLEQTQLQLMYTKINAPISGRAGSIAVKAGNLIKDNDAALVTLLQMAPIYVTFGLPEQLLPEVRKYNTQHPLQVEATPQGGQTETGTLRFIDSSVDATTGTIKLKAQFDNKGQTLWPGSFVNVQARLRLEQNRILIPSRAIQTGPQGKYVWVMNKADSTVAMRPVDVLRIYKTPQTDEQAVIGTGLKAGEMVISDGQMRLMPGGKVSLLTSAAQVGQP
jgi:membrane fusion protein, multidrug efflux system